MPHLANHADDMCMIRSMYTEQFNHHPAQLMLQSGTALVGRPTMGAWALYGLGSESESLPGFVVLRTGGVSPGAGSGNWSSGFNAVPPTRAFPSAVVVTLSSTCPTQEALLGSCNDLPLTGSAI